MPPKRDDTGETTATSFSPSPSTLSNRAKGLPSGDRLSPEDILDTTMILPKVEPNLPFYKHRRFHFVVGILVGALLVLLLYMAPPDARIQFEELQNFVTVNLAELDLPALLPQSLLAEEFMSNITSFLRPPAGSEGNPFQPGLSLREEFDLKPHFPIVLIPGIVSTGLESWSTANCSQRYFRKRMWGTLTMFRAVLTDKACWTKHLKLDPKTGLDPEGIKLRAAQGLDAADYFVPGYWIWGKLIENFAAVGYDSNNMHLAAYDWRLSFSNLENRDHYFSRLKSNIEHSLKWEKRKTVVLAHSMGSLVFYYFLKWAESPKGGNGGENWTENHIESFINIAGPLLGVPKGLTALLSGETRDTMDLGSYGAYALEKFFSKRERAELFRTWVGGSSMLPKGGDGIWGNLTWAPDDRHPHTATVSYGNMLAFPPDVNDDVVDDPKHGGAGVRSQAAIMHNHTARLGIELLHRATPQEYHEMLRTNYSYGISTSKEEIEKNEKVPNKWTNVVESRLPLAPNMRIYCFYGVGIETERSYFYARSEAEDGEIKLICGEGEGGECIGEDGVPVEKLEVGSVPNRPLEFTNPPNVYIDGTVHDEESKISTGVHFGEGDGTVPLLSNGFMCASGWTTHAKLYNPAGSPVVIREYLHEVTQSPLDIRGGSKSADHINILGNYEMTADILHLVCNHNPNEIKERLYSDIKEYGAKVSIEHLP